MPLGMRPLTPWLTAFRTRTLFASGAEPAPPSSSSRFGPTTPSVPALARVWQAPQLIANSSLPWVSPADTLAGEVEDPPSLLIAQAGIATAQRTAKTPNQM